MTVCGYDDFPLTCNRDLRYRLNLTEQFVRSAYLNDERFVLRQRVVGNDNPIKLGRCFQFLNNWYGFDHGGDHGNQYTVAKEKIFTLPNTTDDPSTQSELAEKYGITKQTMNNYMRLAKSIPELEELVDTAEEKMMIGNREK